MGNLSSLSSWLLNDSASKPRARRISSIRVSSLVWSKGSGADAVWIELCLFSYWLSAASCLTILTLLGGGRASLVAKKSNRGSLGSFRATESIFSKGKSFAIAWSISAKSPRSWACSNPAAPRATTASRFPSALHPITTRQPAISNSHIPADLEMTDAAAGILGRSK